MTALFVKFLTTVLLVCRNVCVCPESILVLIIVVLHSLVVIASSKMEVTDAEVGRRHKILRNGLYLMAGILSTVALCGSITGLVLCEKNGIGKYNSRGL